MFEMNVDGTFVKKFYIKNRENHGKKEKIKFKNYPETHYEN